MQDTEVVRDELIRLKNTGVCSLPILEALPARAQRSEKDCYWGLGPDKGQGIRGEPRVRNFWQINLL